MFQSTRVAGRFVRLVGLWFASVAVLSGQTKSERERKLPEPTIPSQNVPVGSEPNADPLFKVMK